MRVLLLLLISACLAELVAQPAPPAGRDYAVFFIGTSYDDGKWIPLPEAFQEASGIAKELEDNYNVECRIYQDLTKAEIRSALTGYRSSLAPGDQLIVYFSMHGEYKEDQDGFLIPREGRSDDPDGRSWYSYSELRKDLRDMLCLHLLLLLDACHAGAFVDRYKGRPDGPVWNTDPEPDQNNLSGAMLYRARQLFCVGTKKDKAPASSQFARKILETLQAKGDRGIVRTMDFKYFLDRLESPKPVFKTFEGHIEPGDFVLVHQDASHPAVNRPNWRAIDDLTFSSRIIPEKLAFIPGGRYLLGSTEPVGNDLALRQVFIPDLYFFRYEVTNAEYCTFLNEEGNKLEAGDHWIDLSGQLAKGGAKNHIYEWNNHFYVERAYENFPVANVSWLGANAYAAWLSRKTGEVYRLPKEDEWECAAGNGMQRSTYSWGNANPDKKKGGNVADETAAQTFYNNWTIFTGYTDGFAYTAPVGQFAPNDFGIYDMTGNVLEWCTTSKNEAVAKGGAWDTSPSGCRVQKRFFTGENPATHHVNTGFRLVRVASSDH